MAKPFLVIDLSPQSRDFESTSLEAGIPLIDKPGANWAILRKWLGTNVAEPEWMRDQRVGFFIRNDDSARPDNPNCQTVTEADLNGPFRDSLQKLLDRVESANPDGAKEELVKRVAQRELKSLINDGGRKRERTYYFVKYRQANGKWQ